MLASRDLSDARRRAVALVVAEAGADSERWASELAGEGPVVVIAAAPGERADELARRLRERLDQLEGEGRRVVSALLSGGAALDAEIMEARTSIVRAISSVMVRAGRGRLMLASPLGLTGSAQHAMAALAEITRESVRGAGVDVDHVLPPRERRGSGVRRIPMRDVA